MNMKKKRNSSWSVWGHLGFGMFSCGKSRKGALYDGMGIRLLSFSTISIP